MTERYCKVCSEVIHPKRVQLGYDDTCVKHSQTKKFMGLVVTEGKESEEISSIQVIRNPKIMEELDRLKPPSSLTDIY
jgi:RNA polymerase subunit RPABC4/transcription elongation factor Spt4